MAREDNRKKRFQPREEEVWLPKTELGKAVKEGKVTDIADIFDRGLPILETEIVDKLLPELSERDCQEVLSVNMVQRMTDSGRRVKFACIVVIGNKNGYVGLGCGKAQEVGPAIRKAITDAKPYSGKARMRVLGMQLWNAPYYTFPGKRQFFKRLCDASSSTSWSWDRDG